jgi:Undecaprenyl-phosphate glucose phosphotransferase
MFGGIWDTGRAGAGEMIPPIPRSASRRGLLHPSERMVVDLLALADIVIVAIAALVAKFIYITLFLESDQAPHSYLIAGLLGGALVYYTARNHGLHEVSAILNWRERLYDLVLSVGTAFVLLLVVAFLFKVSKDYSRGWMLTWFALSVGLITLWRVASTRILNWLHATGSTARRIAVVTTDTCGEQVSEQLRKIPGVGVTGVFTLGREGDNTAATMQEIIAIGERNEIDEIIVAFSRPDERLASLVKELNVLPVHVWLHYAELGLPISGAQRLGSLNLLETRSRPICDWGYVSKTVFDYVVGAICLLVFAPLMLLIALAIRLDSPGPALFRQRRNGYNHRIIDVYKFRTMRVMEDGDTVRQASKDDDRVTFIGKFLRRTSLDELPQLFNVLRGEMSLVGPRPHALAHNDYYRRQIESYALRHLVRPGITGLSQINGLRGGTEDPEMMARRVQTDLYYIEHWSLLMDIKIIALTPFKGFINPNAY